MDSIQTALRDCGVNPLCYDPSRSRLRESLHCAGLSPKTLCELDDIEQIDGDLIIEGGAVTQLDGFNALRKLRRLEIRNAAALGSIRGFNALESLGTLIITNNGALTEITGFQRLFTAQPHITGAIKITDNGRLQSVSFLRGLRRAGSSLHLHSNALTSLAGLEALERVDASLSLSSNRLTSLKALGRLTWVDGMLGVVNNSDLESLEGLEGLEHLKTVKWSNQLRTIALNKNPRLRDISALERVRTSDGFMVVICDDFGRYTSVPSASSPFFTHMLEVQNKATGRVARMGGRTKFPRIAGISSNADAEKGCELENLIQGQGVGFDAAPPYGSISNKRWSTTKAGGGQANYFDSHGPVIIDLKLYELESFDAIGIWPSRITFGNSIKDFTLQFSATHSENGLSEPIAMQAWENNPFDVEVFRFPRVEANFIRMTIYSNHREVGLGGKCVDFQEIAVIRDAEALASEIDSAASNACDHDFLRPLIGKAASDLEYDILNISPEFSLDNVWRPDMTYREFIAARGLAGVGPQLKRINLSKWGDKIYMQHFLKEHGLKGMPVRLWSYRFDGDFMRRLKTLFDDGYTSFVLKVTHLGNSMGIYRVKDGRHIGASETLTKGLQYYGKPVDFDYLEKDISLYLKTQQYHEEWASNMIPPGVMVEDLLDDPTEIKFSVVFGRVVAFYVRVKGRPCFDAQGQPLTDGDAELPWWWKEAAEQAEKLARIIRADHLRIDQYCHKGEVIVGEVTWNGKEHQPTHDRIARALNDGYAIRRAHRAGYAGHAGYARHRG